MDEGKRRESEGSKVRLGNEMMGREEKGGGVMERMDREERGRGSRTDMGNGIGRW